MPQEDKHSVYVKDDIWQWAKKEAGRDLSKVISAFIFGWRKGKIKVEMGLNEKVEITLEDLKQ